MGKRTETSVIQWRLTEWARWSKQKVPGAKGYPSQTPFRRLLGSSVSSAQISDEEGDRIEAAVKRLGERSEEQHRVLVCYYKDRCSVAAIKRLVGCSYDKTRRLLAQSETAIEYMLDPENI